MRELTDWELSQEWTAFFGPAKGARLMGWLVLTALLLGRDVSREDVLERGPLARAQRYRNVADLTRFVRSLRERGLVVPGAGEPIEGSDEFGPLVEAVTGALDG